MVTVRNHFKNVLAGLALGVVVGIASGIASAVFLGGLDWATRFREAHRPLVYALPLAGAALGWVYGRWGMKILGGNNLVLESVHEDSPEIPLRMAPMVLAGTVLTHLFGGSAGREGTAVQMGASLADFISHRLGVNRELRRRLLVAGIAGGFGSVFGTPVAGVLFGMEVVEVGGFAYQALIPAVLAAFVGDWVTRALGNVHTPYPTLASFGLTPLIAGKWLVVAGGVAVTAVAFIELTHFLKRRLKPIGLPGRMALGGVTVVLLWWVSGTDAYLGLGVPGILRAFSDASLPQGAFAWKLVFTAVTLGAGFIGGEVTPLFFIGAALGNLLGRMLGLPLGLSAGVGMAAMFGAAAKTPLALSMMAVELFGMAVLPHVALVTGVAYWLTGRRSIYASQRWRH